MARIEKTANIKFTKLKTKINSSFITITGNEEGCYSSTIGRESNSLGQKINLGKGCVYFVTVMHELFHSLGFYHEQSRPDRDNYVTVYLNNTDFYNENTVYQFKPVPDIRVTRFTPYDYDSIMHYDAFAFTNNRRPTIVPKHPVPLNRIGNAKDLSFYDIETLQKIYGKPNEDAPKPIDETPKPIDETPKPIPVNPKTAVYTPIQTSKIIDTYVCYGKKGCWAPPITTNDLYFRSWEHVSLSPNSEITYACWYGMCYEIGAGKKLPKFNSVSQTHILQTAYSCYSGNICLSSPLTAENNNYYHYWKTISSQIHYIQGCYFGVNIGNYPRWNFCY